MRGWIAVLPFVAGCDVLFQLQHLDPPPSEPPAVVAMGVGNCAMCATETLSFTVVDGRPSSLLLVSVAVSGSSPAIVSVTYGDSPLSFLVRGYAASAAARTVLETWQLVDPPPGAAPLTVTVGSNAAAIVVGVAQFDGAREIDPVRASAAAGSMTPSTEADNTVESADLDLVVDTICAGTSIDAPGMTQDVLYFQNLTSAYACGNLASSVTVGAPPSVAVHWSVNGGNADHWIDVATSIASGP